MKRELPVLFGVSILTFFSLIVWPGYDVFIGDHKVYVPPIQKALTPDLFEGDLLLSHSHGSYSFFDELVVFLIKLLNRDILHVFILLTSITRFVFFYSIYRILFFFTDDRMFPFIPMSLFILGRFANATFNTYLVPRGMSLAVNLLFVAFYLNQKKLLSALFLGFGLLIHPMICLPFLIFFYLDLFILSYRSTFSNVKSVMAAIVPILFLITLILNTDRSETPLLSLFRSLDPSWEEILNFRFPDLFLLSWENSGLLFLAAGSIFCFVVSKKELVSIFREPRKRKYLCLFFFIPAASFLMYYIGFDIFRINIVELTQIIRSRFFWQIVIVPLFVYYAYNHIMAQPNDFIYNFSLVGISISLCVRGGGYAPFLYIPMFTLLWVRRNKDLFHLAGTGFVINKYVPGVLFALSIFGVSVVPLLDDDVKALVYLGLTVPLSLLAVTMVARWHRYFIGYKPVYMALILMAVSIVFYIPRFKITPAYYHNQPLMEACKWIRRNTTEKDVFLSEPFTHASGPLRMTCQRSLFNTYEDGGQAQFVRDYALEWKRRYDLVMALKVNKDVIRQIMDLYDVDYVFSDSKIDIGYPLVFDNGHYYIYRLRKVG